ncbi:Raf kinase inhibitor-like YbhB/YbcL family protein [Methanolinea mesophila]|uniref:YbhB/YbcL family Raf kinase inhibitor-like protein n=1 Tax=Methanolinea mesophila TaxID=547055 RepID=UPI001AE47316|nr:YbhB/YbcL family Raf kinase inhibitor-like protein [Methanolinea mesophila]MBP1929763.1 Raf kinase inhibitor-like YbhB/YbcL family protein [Methanolinea mesophila]
MIRTVLLVTAFVLLVMGVLIAGCSSPALHSPPGASGGNSGSLEIQVGSLHPGSALPVEYTCAGAGISPAISWTGVPPGTRSLVLILHDPDAPLAGGFTHWIVYNIPPDSPGIPGNVTSARELPGGGFQGQNSRGSSGYIPPCPPEGSAPHHYVFSIYALDTAIENPNPNRSAILADITGHTIGEAEVIVIYGQ